MNQDILQIIQAEVDGVASESDISRLETAAAADPEVAALRRDYIDMAQAIGRMPAVDAPLGFTDRVMAALPPVVERVPVAERIRVFIRSVVPAPRQQLAFAFALGVVVTLGIAVVLMEAPQPGTDLLAGTLAGPADTRVPLANGAGSLESVVNGDVRQVFVRPGTSGPVTVTVEGAESAPALSVLSGSTPVTVVSAGASVVIEAASADVIQFSIARTVPVEIRVATGEIELLAWSPDPGTR